MTTEQQYADLREYFRVLRARKYQICLVTLAVLAAALFISFQQTPVYQATAKVLVRGVPIASLSASGQRPDVDVETERELIMSQTVAEDVKSRLRLTEPPEQLLRQLVVTVVQDTEILVVGYRDVNAAQAARLAAAFADSYVTFRAKQVSQQFEAADKTIHAQINEIQKQVTGLDGRLAQAKTDAEKLDLQAQRDQLVAQLGALQLRLIDIESTLTLTTDSAQILQRPGVPTAPVTPQKVRNGMLGLAVGLSLGVALAFLRERMDDRFRSSQELERRLGAPVLAAVPRVSGWHRGNDTQLIMKSDPKSPVSEAYRTLATNIQYLASQQPLRVLMVTSSMGGEGKTTTSSNLAMALAQVGKRVILVSADLRRSRLHRFFGLTNDMGLSNVLSDGTTLSQVAKNPGVNNLRVVDAGPVPPNPAELLGSVRASLFIESLREVADFVIIDTPPVLAVADASILATLVDGTILVMDATHSSRSALHQSRDQLERAGASIVGAVYNNFDPNQGAAYPYSSYYYQYYAGDDEISDGAPRKLRRKAKRAGKPVPWGADQNGGTSQQEQGIDARL
jgi:capsular exopolysaccharide synthesis family protein